MYGCRLRFGYIMYLGGELAVSTLRRLFCGFYYAPLERRNEIRGARLLIIYDIRRYERTRSYWNYVNERNAGRIKGDAYEKKKNEKKQSTSVT